LFAEFNEKEKDKSEQSDSFRSSIPKIDESKSREIKKADNGKSRNRCYSHLTRANILLFMNESEHNYHFLKLLLTHRVFFSE
jgi:hypothetical protein